jgi:K+-transporting ATPase KdpF subunit
LAKAEVAERALRNAFKTMTLESIVGLVISVALLAYLVLAMMRPEKF